MRFRYAQGYQPPQLDDQQSLTDANGVYADGALTFSFTRPLNTGDANDADLTQCLYFVYPYDGGPTNFEGALLKHDQTPAVSKEKICLGTCGAVPSAEPGPETSPEPEPKAESTAGPVVVVPVEGQPTPEPSPEPTPEPSAEPGPEPSAEPSPEPSAEPTPEPSAEPTAEPSSEPSAEPAPVTTAAGSPEPYAEPEPSAEPKPEPEPATTTEATTTTTETTTTGRYFCDLDSRFSFSCLLPFAHPTPPPQQPFTLSLESPDSPRMCHFRTVPTLPGIITYCVREHISSCFCFSIPNSIFHLFFSSTPTRTADNPPSGHDPRRARME